MTSASTSPAPPRKLLWSVVFYLGAIHALALLALWPATFSWPAVGVALLLHWITGGLGVTLGFHRLVSHRSFTVPKWLEYLLVTCGTLSAQGGVINWVGLHRMHHRYSDTEPDPHDANAGFGWSHMGWMLYDIPANHAVYRYTKDIAGDPVYRFLQRNFISLQVVLGGLLYLLGGWPFVVWGVFVRLVAVFHCTWFVNSATHAFGYRNFDCDDLSKNCWWVALLTYGEGWHNNHHAYPYSARHGLRWWEIDATWGMVRILQALGLARHIKLPPASARVGTPTPSQ